MSKSPGIFYHSKFVVGGNAGALDYADDKDKLPDQLSSSLFLNYMDNPKKASGLINMEGRYVTLEERKELTQLFDMAEEKGSLLWQDLFSFDHTWLSEHGMYDERTQTFDLMRISKAIIASEKYVFEQEGYQKPVGCFAFHTNTDNLHAHFSMMELEPSREMGYFDIVDKETGEITRELQPIGKRDKRTIKGARRIFANKLLHFDDELSKITSLIRDTIVAKAKEKEVFLDPELEEAFLALYKKLPNQRNRWAYGYAKGQKFLDPLNHLIQLHLDKFYSKEYAELVSIITKLDEGYQATYHGERGEQTKGYKEADGIIQVEMDRIDEGGKGFKENKLTDLYTRLGNAILREVKEMDRDMRMKELNPSAYFSQKSLGKQVEIGMAALRPRSYYEKEEKRVKESLFQLRAWKKNTLWSNQTNSPRKEADFEQLLHSMPPLPEEPGYVDYMTPEAHFEEIQLIVSEEQQSQLEPTQIAKENRFLPIQSKEKDSIDLQSLRSYYSQKVTVERKAYQNIQQREVKQTYLSPKEYKKAVETEKMVQLMRKAFRKEYRTWINEQAFEQLIKEMDWIKQTM
ncbi:hypothetical protein CWJ10_14355 [Listeria monocytogenes]|uniref:MobP2 family relaxase n=1 Tax=Listeria monocytogenes TaxID=1639 RepID=UPI0010B7F5CD|nr:MobP2 family relaxase [Listeria monocytogenes]EAC3131979.1 hypothetical protein [Listeria monocytogenes]EAC6780744.1 hypothetical protein [Listeria monocytogenes]EAD0722615.1 hypothetical protein [Listeria monocytogenes]EAD3056029.1 hypothetical protein [Listeria monocytogenes]EAF4031931.1 hypothetical protein [Listeria monocytogenes]